MPAHRHGLQCRQVVRNVYSTGMVDVFNHRTQGIGGPKEHVGDRAVGRELTIANQAKDGLQRVSQLFDPGKLKETGGSFDRVNRAKDRVDQFDVDGLAAGLDRQQLALDIGQMVARFHYELVDDLPVVHRCTPNFLGLLPCSSYSSMSPTSTAT